MWSLCGNALCLTTKSSLPAPQLGTAREPESKTPARFDLCWRRMLCAAHRGGSSWNPASTVGKNGPFIFSPFWLASDFYSKCGKQTLVLVWTRNKTVACSHTCTQVSCETLLIKWILLVEILRKVIWNLFSLIKSSQSARTCTWFKPSF